MEAITNTLWILGAALEFSVLVVGWYRRLYREMPLFYCYVLSHFVRNIVLWVAHLYSYRAYYYIFWFGEFIDAVLVIAVLQELFTGVFAPYLILQKRGMAAFRWTTLILIGSAVYAGVVAHGAGANRTIRALLTFERSANFVQAGLVVILFLLVAYYGLVWKPHQFGVALGYGLMGATVMAAMAIRIELGRDADPITGWVYTAGYDLGVMTWAIYLALKSPATLDGHLPLHSDLQRWNNELRSVAERSSLPRTTF